MGFIAAFPGSRQFWGVVNEFRKSTTDSSPDVDKERLPGLTFGLEMELGFAVRNKFYEGWIATASENDYTRDATALSDWMTIRTNMRAAQAQLKALRIQRNIPISPTSSTSSKDSNLTTSSNPEGRNKLIGYIMAYLNRKTADAPATPSLIGPIETSEAKKGGYNAWNVMLDESVMPRRKSLRNPLQIDKQTAQTEYRVVGAELVSSILDFDNEQDWLPKLQQLENDLTFNETSDRGAWFYDLTHLHVHFAIKDKELSLPVATTVCALYGLFENEIQSWLPITQRESPFCKRLRLGMEKERLAYDADGTDVLLLPGKRFTPREFTDRLHSATTLQELKTEVSGWSAGEWVHPQSTRTNPSYDIKTNCYPVFAREWVAVNVSLGRENKPHTLEFRHHHGTMDPETIRWWIKFLGRLVQFSDQLVEKNVQLQETGPVQEDSWIDEIANKSILDLIGFPAAGIAHFHNMRDANIDPAHQQKINQEDLLVAERIIRRRQGQATGREMDDDILGITVPQPQRRGEEAARPVVLKGQPLVDRLLRIVEDHKAMDEHGVTSPTDLARARAVITAGHATAWGYDYTTLQGLTAVNDIVFDDRIGIGRVWGDAMSMAVLLRFARMQQQDINNVVNAAQWEQAFLIRGRNTFTLR